MLIENRTWDAHDLSVRYPTVSRNRNKQAVLCKANLRAHVAKGPSTP